MATNNDESNLNRRVSNIDKNYSVMEASKLTGLSQSWFRQKMAKREIEFLRLGGRVFIRAETLMTLLRDGIVNPR